MFLFELEEIHSKCGSHYEMHLEKGVFFVYCSTCKLSWKPCESAFKQYREQNENFVYEKAPEGVGNAK